MPIGRSISVNNSPPTLITWGKNDGIFTVEGAELFKRDLPNAELHLLDTGHFALEEELDRIGSLMREFLDRTIKRERKQFPEAPSKETRLRPRSRRHDPAA